MPDKPSVQVIRDTLERHQLPATSRHLVETILALEQYALPLTVDEFETLNIVVPPLLVWIQRRPPYCDRGRWQVNAESADDRLLTIDWADGFPRYYYLTDTMVKEVAAFIELRMQNYRRKHGE